MKKGTRLADTLYTLELRTLARKRLYHYQSFSLREVVQRAAGQLPGMAGYSKVYRFLREHAGVYAGLVVVPDRPETERHVLVTITSRPLPDPPE